jgi:hypothetical protein
MDHTRIKLSYFYPPKRNNRTSMIIRRMHVLFYLKNENEKRIKLKKIKSLPAGL